MGGSAAYARIRHDVLAIAAAVPPGRLVTHAAIGAHLDVMPRHVAYILAMLTAEEKDRLPWHRVVGADGTIRKPRPGATSQAALLLADGVSLGPDGRVADLQHRLADVPTLPHGIARQTRPAAAPTGGRRSPRATA